MSRTDEPEDDFSADERAALNAWRTPEPKSGLAEAVLARLQSPAPRSGRTGLRLAIAAGLAAAAIGGWAALRRSSGAVHGESIRPEVRTTLALGSRGLAVAEAGSVLAWEVGADGDAHLTQDAGSAFYRVEPGGAFVVETALLEARVMGTCFRVDVRREAAGAAKGVEGSHMKNGTKLAGAALAGALVTAAVFVTVYEGRVALAADGQVTEIGAGQTGTVRPGQAVVVEDTLQPIQAVEVVPVAVAPGEVAPAPTVPPASAPSCDPKALEAAARNAQLERDRAADLQDQLAEKDLKITKLSRIADKYRTFDLSPAALQEMAKKCELRWDHPAVRVGDSPTLEGEAAKEAGLTDDEKKAVNAELAKFNQRTLAELRRLYTQVTGDEEVSNLAAEAMLAEINDKSEARDIRLAFERLSAERAGLAAPPTDATEVTPVEQIYRVLTTAGDQLEAAIAEHLGADRARALREHRNGWGSASRSSFGCPVRTP